MAADKNNKLVLYGGTSFLNQTWLWDGTNWTQATPRTSPPARAFAAMAADKNHDVVLFGGATNYTLTKLLNDTWLWDGQTWRKWASATGIAPSGRIGASMTIDKNGNLVLFGGGVNFFSGTCFNDTWLWTGRGWKRASPTTSPPARNFATMATDQNGNVILFGGQSCSTALLDDTWLWNGTTWTQLSPATSPPARQFASSATDKNGNIALYGGFTPGQGGFYDDTWLFSP